MLPLSRMTIPQPRPRHVAPTLHPPLETPQMTIRDVLALPAVRRLWIGQLVSIAGDFLAMFAILSIASFCMHATPAAISSLTIAYMIPLAILGPVAGGFVDRWNPKHTMIASDVLRAWLILLLLRAHRVEQLDLILFAVGTVSAFFLPAQSVTIRLLVPREGWMSANTLLQQTTLILRLASPALAGVLAARCGPPSCFYFDSLSFAGSAWMLAGIPALPRHRPGRQPARDLAAGLRFILRHFELAFVTAAMAAAAFAISCSSPLIALFVRDILHAGISAFAWISSAIGLGLIAGTQSVRQCSRKAPPDAIVRLGLVLAALGIVGIGASRAPVFTAAGAFLMGAGVGLLTVPAQTLLQTETPLPMAGRVSSAVISGIAMAQIAGLAASGMLADRLGLRPVFLVSASLLAALVCASLHKNAQICTNLHKTS